MMKMETGGDEESMISLSSKVEGRQGEGRERDVGFNFGEGRERSTHTHTQKVREEI